MSLMEKGGEKKKEGGTRAENSSGNKTVHGKFERNKRPLERERIARGSGAKPTSTSSRMLVSIFSTCVVSSFLLWRSERRKGWVETRTIPLGGLIARLPSQFSFTSARFSPSTRRDVERTVTTMRNNEEHMKHGSFFFLRPRIFKNLLVYSVNMSGKRTHAQTVRSCYSTVPAPMHILKLIGLFLKFYLKNLSFPF